MYNNITTLYVKWMIIQKCKITDVKCRLETDNYTNTNLTIATVQSYVAIGLYLIQCNRMIKALAEHSAVKHISKHWVKCQHRLAILLLLLGQALLIMSPTI